MEERSTDSLVSRKSRLFRTFSKVTTRSKLYKQNREASSHSFNKCCSWPFDQRPLTGKTLELKTRASLVQALLAKIFAGVSTIKAAYAELQVAQHPYNEKAVQTADDAIVAELRSLSELKQGFVKKQINLSPQVTLLLSEIQEQQSVMKTYDIMLRKIEAESRSKDAQIELVQAQLRKELSVIKSMETKLNSTGALSILQGVDLRDLTHFHFSQALHYALRSVRSFAKILVREMEDAGWDLSLAARSISPGVKVRKQSHRIYAFESFVNRALFAGFNGGRAREKHVTFREFEKLRSLSPKQVLIDNPGSGFGDFLRSTLVNLVHPKMESLLFGGVPNRRSSTTSCLPEVEAFTALAEVVKRVWLLKLLRMSFCGEVSAFWVREGCRFSEVYMESVVEEEVEESGRLAVGFTVAPGFQVGGTVVQSSVYLSPAINRPLV